MEYLQSFLSIGWECKFFNVSLDYNVLLSTSSLLLLEDLVHTYLIEPIPFGFFTSQVYFIVDWLLSAVKVHFKNSLSALWLELWGNIRLRLKNFKFFFLFLFQKSFSCIKVDLRLLHQEISVTTMEFPQSSLDGGWGKFLRLGWNLWLKFFLTNRVLIFYWKLFVRY